MVQQDLGYQVGDQPSSSELRLKAWIEPDMARRTKGVEQIEPYMLYRDEEYEEIGGSPPKRRVAPFVVRVDVMSLKGL